MYLVEKAPGQEELYNSPAELAAAIRSGAVKAESRIFHRTTSTWLPITVHPAYRELAARIAGEGSQQPMYPPLPRKQWTFLPFEEESKSAGQAQPSAAAAASEAPASASAQSGVGEKPRRRFRFWR